MAAVAAAPASDGTGLVEEKNATTNVSFEMTNLRNTINAEKQSQMHGAKQLWKQWDELANKSGAHKAVFWVNEKKMKLEDRIMLPENQAKEKLWKTASVYSGEWKQNGRHGYGTQEWPNGNRYEGDWAFGKRHGTGTMYIKLKKNKLRKVYAGQWKHDRKEGIGVYFYKDGSRYEGEWQAGMHHGHGTFFAVDGSVYIGEWVEGKRCGWGRLVHENGDEYVGEWLNDKKEGQGQFFYRSRARVYDGEWVNGIAKCGVYGAIEDAPDTSTSPNLPQLELESPDDVIQARLEGILKQRAAVRALPLIQMADLFNESELHDLNKLFETADQDANNRVGVLSLRRLLEDVGLQVTDEDIAEILHDMDKDTESLFTFAEFVKSIYLVKEKELHDETSLQDADTIG